jgi:membrane fusion protein (multidrug efflux system)
VIKSPVTGVSGEALVREGTYLSMGPGGHLSYVAQLDPIWVTFSISQNQMSQGQQEIAAGRVIPPIDQNYVIEIELSDGSRYPHTGKLNFVSSVFSQETGTFLVRAELPNPEGVLRPGMFVKARVKGAMHPDALVVPQKAVQQTSNGHVVFIVSSSETAEVRPVIVGEWVGSDWVINQGLKAGEQVIVDGFQRLRPETPVKVVAAPATVTEPVAAPPAK